MKDNTLEWAKMTLKEVIAEDNRRGEEIDRLSAELAAAKERAGKAEVYRLHRDRLITENQKYDIEVQKLQFQVSEAFRHGAEWMREEATRRSNKMANKEHSKAVNWPENNPTRNRNLYRSRMASEVADAISALPLEPTEKEEKKC